MIHMQSAVIKEVLHLKSKSGEPGFVSPPHYYFRSSVGILS